MEESLAAAPKYRPGWKSEHWKHTIHVPHLQSSKGKVSTCAMLWECIWFDCKGGSALCAHTTSASQGCRASTCSHQGCSQMRNSGAFVYPNGVRRACLQRKYVSGIFPLGYGCAWFHSVEVVWEEAQSGVLHISFLPSAHFRQSQPSPLNTFIPRALPQVMVATSSKISQREP